MKKTALLTLVLIFALTACKKDEDKDTTYQVYNASSVTIEDVMTYYYYDNQMFDLTRHWDLAPGYKSNKIKTDREYITVMFKMNNIQYKVVSPYKIEGETNNILHVSNSTIVEHVK